MRLGVAETNTMFAAIGPCVMTVVDTMEVPAFPVKLCVPEHAAAPVWLRYALRAIPKESVSAVGGSKVPHEVENSTGNCTAGVVPPSVAATDT